MNVNTFESNKAAEQMAKERAIAFLNWTLTDDCQYTATDHDQWTDVANHLNNKTTEELYQVFESQIIKTTEP